MHRSTTRSLRFLFPIFLAAYFLLPFGLLAQEWEVLTEKLFSEGENPEFADDTFNRKLGGLLAKPNGELLLVRNGQHPIYRSRNQGKTWKPLKGVETKGRAYGSFSFSYDYATGKTAIFMIVQQKHSPAQGLVLSPKNHVLTTIGKPSDNHDGWTWGMPAWEQASPQLILGKEHHKWVIMWVSRDGGSTWQQLDFKSRNPGVIDAQTFVAGNDDGIYRSADQGENWQKVADFVVTGKNPIRYGQNFYWTTEQGVIWSQDQGKSWELLGNALEGVLWGPYFGTTENSMMVVNAQGFYISTDHGETWEQYAEFFAPPSSNRDGQYNVMHPTNSYGWDEKRGIIYAAGLGGHAYRLRLGKGSF